MLSGPQDSAWNRTARAGETEAERADRNFRDLLTELRITLSGSQILFAFLLVIPFSGGFAHMSELEKGMYFATVVISALSAGLLVAPAVMHRVIFRQHLKDHLVNIAGFIALGGQSLFAVALSTALFFIGSYVYNLAAGIAVAVLLFIWYGAWFFAVPLALRARAHRNQDVHTVH